MSKISAEVIADSRNPFGDRITSFVLTFPRFILAELNTHRVFSKNSASSRAIPFKKMVERVKEDPFIPMAWQKDHKGMQGTEYLTGKRVEKLKTEWLRARDRAVEQAERLNQIGLTKQICNRVLEPFMWHTVILTGTDFDNFFHLRCPRYAPDNSGEHFECYSWGEFLAWHTDPQYDLHLENADTLTRLRYNRGESEIHMMALAEAMVEARRVSEPVRLKANQWHIPFGDKFDPDRLKAIADKTTLNLPEGERGWLITEAKIKIATARCARVSYLNFEGKDDYESDIRLYNQLMESQHWSPFEHCAQAMGKGRWEMNGSRSRNFKGFTQYREYVDELNTNRIKWGDN